MVARYGGEEFCVMLTSTALSRALETAERIRSRVEEEVFLPELSHRDVTVSIGVASYQELGGTVVDFVKSADEAMYEVKSSQRNGVKAAQSSR
jgi:diguanylate cyclase (GGDEF)-like protein